MASKSVSWQIVPTEVANARGHFRCCLLEYLSVKKTNSSESTINKAELDTRLALEVLKLVETTMYTDDDTDTDDITTKVETHAIHVLKLANYLTQKPFIIDTVEKCIDKTEIHADYASEQIKRYSGTTLYVTACKYSQAVTETVDLYKKIVQYVGYNSLGGFDLYRKGIDLLYKALVKVDDLKNTFEILSNTFYSS